MYSFLDNDFQKNYEKDQRVSGIVSYFTFIAILIACLGLFGLSAFSAEQRTREIGIRKVLGASVTNVASLLSKDFIKLVLIALIIASPLAWFAMNKWLQGFAYRTPISWWMFVLAGLGNRDSLTDRQFPGNKSSDRQPCKKFENGIIIVNSQSSIVNESQTSEFNHISSC